MFLISGTWDARVSLSGRLRSCHPGNGLIFMMFLFWKNRPEAALVYISVGQKRRSNRSHRSSLQQFAAVCSRRSLIESRNTLRSESLQLWGIDAAFRTISSEELDKSRTTEEIKFCRV